MSPKKGNSAAEQSCSAPLSGSLVFLGLRACRYFIPRARRAHDENDGGGADAPVVSAAQTFILSPDAVQHETKWSGAPLIRGRSKLGA
jgi:hypothetical protein